MINEQALRNLNNFLSSYTLQHTELLNQVFDYITEGIHYTAQSNSSKEQLLDFLESLEELLQAMHGVHEQR